MALQYLPAERISALFEKLSREANTSKLLEFIQYMQTTWIDGSMWIPQDWSVFMMTRKMNNDT
jgi:hypothetical protein